MTPARDQPIPDDAARPALTQWLSRDLKRQYTLQPDLTDELKSLIGQFETKH